MSEKKTEKAEKPMSFEDEANLIATQYGNKVVKLYGPGECLHPSSRGRQRGACAPDGGAAKVDGGYFLLKAGGVITKQGGCPAGKDGAAWLGSKFSYED